MDLLWTVSSIIGAPATAGKTSDEKEEYKQKIKPARLVKPHERPDIPFLHKEINIPMDDDVKDNEFINLFYFADCYNAVDVARAKTIYKQKKQNRNSFVLGGGDWFGGGALSKYDKGDLILEVLKEMNCCVSAIGNHEFDFGVQNALEKFVKSRKYMTWLCTNLDYKGDDESVNIYDLVTININNKKIGVYAFLDKNTSNKLSKANGKDFTDNFDLFTDMQTMAKKAVHVLKLMILKNMHCIPLNVN